MASIEKRGKTWCVRYVVKDAYGNIVGQKRKSGFATKADAMEAAKSLEQATARGIDVHGDQLTCGDIMERWFISKQGEVEVTTLSKYSSFIDKLKTHVVYNTPVKNLRCDSIKQVINDLMDVRGISVNSALYYTEPLRYALKWAADTGLLLAYPFSGTKLPRAEKPKQTIVCESDIDDLVKTCKTQNPAFLIPLYLALYGGLCREEVAGLKWDCVNLSTGSVRIETAVTVTSTGKQIVKAPKTINRSRTVTLPRFVTQELAKTSHTCEHVSCSRKGTPYGLSTYNHNLANLVKTINTKRQAEGQQPMSVPSYHDLRHTHAAMLIAMGIQPKVIQERLGHSSIKITMDLYGYLMPGLQEQVADALDSKWASGQASGQVQTSTNQSNVAK